MSDLKPCPFCGDSPTVSTPEWKDDRRYIAMDIECCATIRVSIGWRLAKDMSPSEIKAELDKNAAEYWNRRYTEEEDIDAEARAEAQKPVLTLDGKTLPEFVASCLYDFQEATGCDTAEQYLEAKKEVQEPVAWFAFADSNGPVPLELWGFDQKACKHAVLENARSVGWKGTVEGYLFQKGWTIRPLGFLAPQPPAPCPKCDENEKTLQAIAEHVDWAFIGDLDDVVASRINERNAAISHFAAERDALQSTVAEQAAMIEQCEKALRHHRDLTRPIERTDEALAAIAAHRGRS